jgi:hypothetical protein
MRPSYRPPDWSTANQSLSSRFPAVESGNVGPDQVVRFPVEV